MVGLDTFGLSFIIRSKHAKQSISVPLALKGLCHDICHSNCTVYTVLIACNTPDIGLMPVDSMIPFGYT